MAWVLISRTTHLSFPTLVIGNPVVFHFTDEERSKDPGSSIKDVEDDRRRMGLSDDATPVLSEVEGSSDLLCHQTYSWRKSSRLSVNDVLEIT